MLPRIGWPGDVLQMPGWLPKKRLPAKLYQNRTGWSWTKLYHLIEAVQCVNLNKRDYYWDLSTRIIEGVLFHSTSLEYC